MGGICRVEVGVGAGHPAQLTAANLVKIPTEPSYGDKKKSGCKYWPGNCKAVAGRSGFTIQNQPKYVGDVCIYGGTNNCM